jgi:TatA/E family protein of Tat protein translocase
MEIFGIGPMELILVLIIALMVFGPDKLPEIGAKLGKAMRSMREATHEFSQEIEDARQALEAPMQDIKAPFQEATAAIQAVSHPQQALREALLGEVNRADDSARQPAPEQAEAGAAAVAATGLALAGAAVTTPDGALDGAAATPDNGQPVTENAVDGGANQADELAFVPDVEKPELAAVPAAGGDMRTETGPAPSDADALSPVNGYAEVSESIPAGPSPAMLAPAPILGSEAAAPVEFSQPDAAPAADTAFDMDEFVAVMERVSRRLSSPDNKINEPAIPADLAASAEPVSPAPTLGAPEPEDPQSPASPAVEE